MEEAGLLFPKLVVFGASGQTGHQVVLQALTKGYSVTAVVRNPEKFNIKQENLEVIQGDVFDPESTSAILKGKNAVISCLGFQDGTLFSPTTLYSKSITSITTAMGRSGVERLVCLTGIYTKKDPSNPWWMDRFLRPLARSFMKDMGLMEDIVTKSNLCYTIVRPPCLSEEPTTDNYLVAEGQSVLVGKVPVGKVPRGDVAHFMLKSLQSKEWDKKGVAIDANK